MTELPILLQELVQLSLALSHVVIHLNSHQIYFNKETQDYLLGVPTHLPLPLILQLVYRSLGAH